MEHINALRGGTRLQEYEIRAVLGQGGFGITYLAFDTIFEREVALKEYLPRDFAARTEGSTVVPYSSADANDYRWGLDRFLKEAQTLVVFDHQHLNKVHRFFKANGTAYMALEYIDGQTLSALLGKYPTVPESHLQRIIREILDGLEEVHEKNYIHRDIKPSNIMLRKRDGSAVLVDFGAARQTVGQRSKSLVSILTPGYAPIEQYDPEAADIGPWSDLYALGMVAYRCVSGAGETALPDAVKRANARRKGGQDLTPAVEVGKGAYAAHFLAAIDWAIEVNEEERPQSIAAWREALFGDQDAAETQPPAPAASPSPVPAAVSAESSATGPRRFSVMSRAALAVVGMAALAAGLYLGVRNGEKPVVGTEDRVAQPDQPDPTGTLADVTISQGRLTGDPAVDWDTTQQIDTPEAYRQFRERHPSNPLAKLAEAKLAAMEGRAGSAEQPDLTGEAAADWERTQRIDTPDAYRQFLSRYPRSPLAKLAELRLAEPE